MRPRGLVALGTLLLWSVGLEASEGMVLYTRGSLWGAGKIRLAVVNASGSVTSDNEIYGQDAHEPKFSPDGTRVVFVRDSDKKVVVMNIDGTGQQDLTTCAGETYPLGSWRHAGKIYVNGGNDLLCYEFSSGLTTKVITGSAQKFRELDISVNLRGVHGGMPPIWAFDLGASSDADTGISGCGGSISHDGATITNCRNDHRGFYLRQWGTWTELADIDTPTTNEALDPQFAGHSNDHVLANVKSTGDKWNVWLHCISLSTWTEITAVSTDNHGSDFYPATLSDPLLAVAPDSLSFTADKDGPNPSGQDVSVTNTGLGTLETVTTTTSYGAGSDWLSVARSGSGNSQTLMNSVDVSGLEGGTYTATVEVHCGNAANSPGQYTVTLDVQAPLPPPWDDGDVGSIGAQGAATYSGSYTVEGSGADIWGTADEFHYVYQPLSGDGHIVARVVSVENTNAWAKAGVMIRETLGSAVRHAFMAVTPGNGATFQRRPTAGGTSLSTSGSAVSAPYWVKLVRTGDTFEGYGSADGSSWTLVGSETISMGAGAYIGMAVTSHNDGTLCTAEFDNVTVVGGGGDTTPPAPPASLSASAVSSTDVFLFWDANTEGDLAGYNVYRSGSPGVPVSAATRVAQGLGSNSHNDTGLTPGTTYYYVVTAVDASDNESGPSNEGSATTEMVSSITLVSPTGGELWYAGTTRYVRWTTTLVDDVTLYYSTNGGSTWTDFVPTLDTSSPDWGSYPWVVPNVSSQDCIVQVADYHHVAGPAVSGSFEIASVTDSDGDGMDDGWETLHFSDLDEDGTGDADADGLTDVQEFMNGCDPGSDDSDSDGLSDAWEVANGLDPTTDDAGEDPDGDGYTNLEEFAAGSDPRDSSSRPGGGGGDDSSFGCAAGAAPWPGALLMLVLALGLARRSSRREAADTAGCRAVRIP